MPGILASFLLMDFTLPALTLAAALFLLLLVVIVPPPVDSYHLLSVCVLNTFSSH